tara:strand:- start:1262 stop:1546 length:285 start_codon:yes stop_codon:yes gene_type:complete
VDNTLNIGDTIVVEENSMTTSSLHQTFNSEWRQLMDTNSNEWTILEMEDNDLAKATNRFTTRATRMNGYTYTDGYQFKCIRRSPYSYFLGRREF